MSHRIRVTFTRQSSDTEWPFWATELSGSTYETKGVEFQDWLSGRDEADMTFEEEPDGNTVYCDINFADENAYNEYDAAMTAAGIGNQFEDQSFIDYCTANNIVVSHVVEHV